MLEVGKEKCSPAYPCNAKSCFKDSFEKVLGYPYDKLFKIMEVLGIR